MKDYEPQVGMIVEPEKGEFIDLCVCNEEGDYEILADEELDPYFLRIKCTKCGLEDYGYYYWRFKPKD